MGENRSSAVIENLLFTRIFQTFRMAIQPTKLIIAFLALAILCLAGWVMDFGKTVVVDRTGNTELDVYMADPQRVEVFIERYDDSEPGSGVFLTMWHFAGDNFQETLDVLFAFNLPEVAVQFGEYFKALQWAFRYHLFYCLIFIAIKLAIVAIAGGGICRISALQFAQDEKPGLTEALRFSRSRFTSFFAAPLVPLGIIIFMGLLIVLLGLIGNIPYFGEVFLGLAMPLTLLAGACVAVMSIGAVVGFNLMFPAVAYDGCDCFDVISRSFSYVYAKPWRMGFYTSVAAVYGAICYTFVRFVVFLLLWATRLFLQLGIFTDATAGQGNKLEAIWSQPTFRHLVGPAALEGNWAETFAAFAGRLWLWVVVGLLVSFVTSFYFTANTIIYALMRNRVDDTPLEDIHTYSHPDGIPTEALPEQPHPEPESETNPEEQAENNAEEA